VAQVVQVTGLRELEAQLLEIGQEYGPKAALSPVRRALGKAAKVVQATAQSIVHRKSGTLAENIIVTTYRKPPEGQIGVKVTVRAKAKGYKSNSRNVRSGKIGLTYNFYGPLFYGSYLEFGTKASKKHHATQAYPYMRPAFEQNKGALPGIIRDELAKAIEATVKRLKK
jgi:HK97 gp10 family phage protein